MKNRRQSPILRRRAPASFDARLTLLAHNLHWAWNPDTQRLFAALDPVPWEATNHDPLATLAQLRPERRASLASDADFLALLTACEQQLKNYLAARTWFQRTATAVQKKLRIAYFSAEFAIHESMPQYAGGLGVLAGDHLKSASDLGIPLVAVGLFYRCGYYRQELAKDGSTRPIYPEYDFTRWPLTDTRKIIRIPLAGRTLAAKVWKLQVGRVPLYLLDTDVAANPPKLRAITRNLYGGDQETRIQQEILLGIGGVAALEAVGEKPNVYHLNEGHAAFATLERLRRLRKRGVAFAAAVEQVKSGGVFTTHTPVPAGHDRFPRAMMRRYLAYMADQVGIPFNALMQLGSENRADAKAPFCMTVLALELSGRRNGVAKLHGRVSREMWQEVFKAATPDNVPITSITNGVHSQTWLAPEMRPLYDKYLKPRWVGAGPRDDWWKNAGRIPPGELWEVRQNLRAKLVNFVRRRLAQQIERRIGPIQDLMAAHEALSEHALTLGFARRFATYKRATLMFNDAARLARIVNDARRPVQIVFAGKAHPRDLGGQALAQRVYQEAASAGFRGRLVLIEDYDMHVGRMLTSGVDVWLNNPLRPQEASGTSGMKPPLHGGLNCSILDGWWPEAYDGENGWAIGDEQETPETATRDRRDAQSFYEVLENEIVPLFYRRDRDGIPQEWVKRMIHSMRTVCGPFSTHRMVAEYLNLYGK